jgi:hypothetical protein
LQAGLAKIEAGLGGTLLDTDKNRNLISRIRKVLSGQLGALSRDVRLKIKDLEDALTGDGKAHGPLQPSSTLTAGRIAKTIGAGLGLTPQQIRGLRLNITGANFTAAALAHGGAAGTVQVSSAVYLDSDRVGHSVSRHQQRSRHRTAPQTRGRVLP